MLRFFCSQVRWLCSQGPGLTPQGDTLWVLTASLTHSASGPMPPLTGSGASDGAGISSWSKFNCNGELLLELINRGSSLCVSQFSSTLLWSEEVGSRLGAITGTKGVISEEPVAPRNGYGEKDADHRGRMGALCRKMVMKVSKEAEGKAEID